MAAYKDWKSYLQDEKAEAAFTETGALWMPGAPPPRHACPSPSLTPPTPSSTLRRYDAAQNAAMQASSSNSASPPT